MASRRRLRGSTRPQVRLRFRLRLRLRLRVWFGVIGCGREVREVHSLEDVRVMVRVRVRVSVRVGVMVRVRVRVGVRVRVRVRDRVRARVGVGVRVRVRVSGETDFRGIRNRRLWRQVLGIPSALIIGIRRLGFACLSPQLNKGIGRMKAALANKYVVQEMPEVKPLQEKLPSTEAMAEGKRRLLTAANLSGGAPPAATGALQP